MPIRTVSAPLLAACLLLLSTDAGAQSSTRVVLGQGATAEHTGTYGGDMPASALSDGCPGFVAALPHFILEVERDGWVRITVDSAEGEDPTLLLRSDSGDICNDDAGENTSDPQIATFLGEYYVHVGAFVPGESGEFEIRFRHGARGPAAERIDDRPVNLLGVSGGTVDAASFGPGCLGTVSSQPHHTLRLRRRANLVIEADSQSDLTLVVRSANATYCNDDARNTLNPSVSGWFEPGRIRVYVGSHNSRINADYNLRVTPVSGN